MSWDPVPGVDKYELNYRLASKDEYDRGSAKRDKPIDSWIVLTDTLLDHKYTIDWNSHKIRPHRYYVFRMRMHLKQRAEWTLWEDRYIHKMNLFHLLFYQHLYFYDGDN